MSWKKKGKKPEKRPLSHEKKTAKEALKKKKFLPNRRKEGVSSLNGKRDLPIKKILIRRQGKGLLSETVKREKNSPSWESSSTGRCLGELDTEKDEGEERRLQQRGGEKTLSNGKKKRSWIQGGKKREKCLPS